MGFELPNIVRHLAAVSLARLRSTSENRVISSGWMGLGMADGERAVRLGRMLSFGGACAACALEWNFGCKFDGAGGLGDEESEQRKGLSRDSELISMT